MTNPLGSFLQSQDGSFEPDPVVLPGPSGHPVLMARILMQAVICIQHQDLTFDGTKLEMSQPKAAMIRYHSLVSGVLASNEELLDSVEALECLVLEGVYLINSGRLRLALYYWRRALTAAQFMGLHHGPNPVRPLKMLDQRTRVSTSIVWLRIVYTERYLSLLLGVPTVLADPDDTPPEDGAGAAGPSPTERLDAIHARAMADMARRDRAGQGPQAFAATLAIDAQLRQAAARLWPPRQWGLLQMYPDMDTASVMAEMLRSQTQIVHFNVLSVLHLSFMLRGNAAAAAATAAATATSTAAASAASAAAASDRCYDYSKTACMEASREVLTRFIAFRNAVRLVSCCHFVDFCALTACLTLLLAHINSHQVQTQAQAGVAGALGEAAQRLNDRALVERALVTMDMLNELNGDDLSRQTAAVARKLLLVEAESATGVTTYYSTLSEDAGADGHDGSLRVPVPQFGTVSVTRETQAATNRQQLSTPVFPSPDAATDFTRYSSAMHLPSPWQQPLPDQQDMEILTAGAAVFNEADNWALQGVDAAFLDAVLGADLSAYDPPGGNMDLSSWELMS